VALNNIKPLDGVRTIAIALVLFWHYIDCEVGGDVGFKTLTFWTWSGVDLFFVLSGFLIGRILIFNRGSKNFFKTFYTRRVLRIFPAYYLVLLGYAILLLSGHAGHFLWLSMDPLPFYSYALYIQNFYMAFTSTGPNWLGVTWSLAIEEQFYLILPLLIFFVNYKNIPGLLILGIILAPIFRAIIPGLGPYVLLPARMDSLLMGVLIAHYHLKGSLEKAFRNRRTGLLAVMLTCFVSLFVAGAGKPMAGIGGVYIHTLLTLLYGTFLILVLTGNPNSSFIKGLSTPFMSFIALISYMIYLSHQVISGLLHELILHRHTPQMNNLNGFLVTVLSLIITIGFSAASYYFFEKPILSLGKKYVY
jgi:peptidoglycan/LPS O-acetylase OafA/YrhL